MQNIKHVILILATAFVLSGDTVDLKDGRKLNGKVQLYDGQQLKLSDGSTFAAQDVVAIQFGDQGAGAAMPPAPANTATASSLPAGTVVAIRTSEVIDSQKARPGQTFPVSLDEELIVNNTVLAPKGADAVLKLVQTQRAGRLSGAAQMSIVLSSVKIGDRMVDVNSEELTSTGAGKGKGSATKIGVGAGAGAILGGIFGGGAGAAIGAAAGAGAGTAVALSTKGPRVTIPSETRLSFTIQ